jgi:hypothetical protein
MAGPRDQLSRDDIQALSGDLAAIGEKSQKAEVGRERPTP